MPPTAASIRRFRHLARVLTAPALGRRKQYLEALLRWRYGDLVEAQGNVLQIDARDRAVGARLRRRGIWSEAETELCRREIRPGMKVLDIGANLGYFTLLFAGLVGEAGQVFAVEPDPHNLELLRGNVARNRLRNIMVLPTALARTEGMATLHKNPENLGDHRLGHDAPGFTAVKVPVTTLDALAEHLGCIDFIKMDVQGAEGAVIAGASAFFARQRNIAMVSELWPAGMRAAGDDPLQYLQRLHELGFELSVIAAGKRLRLHRLSGPDAWRALCERGGEVNLFCRRDASASRRAAAAAAS